MDLDRITAQTVLAIGKSPSLKAFRLAPLIVIDFKVPGKAMRRHASCCLRCGRAIEMHFFNDQSDFQLALPLCFCYACLCVEQGVTGPLLTRSMGIAPPFSATSDVIAVFCREHSFES